MRVARVSSYPSLITNRIFTYWQPYQGPLSGSQTLIQQAESSLCLSLMSKGMSPPQMPLPQIPHSACSVSPVLLRTPHL